MRDIVRTANGRWVEVEDADDIEAVNRRSRTFMGGHLQGAMGGFGYRLLALASDRGPEMPVVALLSEGGGPSMVCGLSNGDPFTHYQEDLAALGDALDMRIPRAAYPYRGSGSFGVVPRLSDLELTPLLDDGRGGRWVAVANAADDAMTALGGAAPVEAAMPLRTRDAEREAGATFLALEMPGDDAPATYPVILRLPSPAERRAGARPRVAAPDGRRPYRKPEVENLIEALGHDLGLDLSEGACDVARPHRPGPTTGW